MRIVADGVSVKVYHGELGETESLIFDESAASLYNGDRVMVLAQESETLNEGHKQVNVLYFTLAIVELDSVNR